MIRSALRPMLFALAAVCSSAFAAELHVPAQHATLQAALDAAAPGDTIVVAAGDFSENLNITKPVTIAGAGADQTTISGSVLKGPVFSASNIDGLVVTGLRLFSIDVRKLEEDAARPVVLDIHGGKTQLENVLLENGASNGIALRDGGYLEARGCHFLKNRGHGLGLMGANTSANLQDCAFIENGTTGVSALDHATIQLKGCTAEANENDAFYFSNVTATVEACTATKSKGTGFAVLDCPGAVVRGNTATGNTGSGITISGGDSACTITGNTCEENGYYGIFADTGATATITDNQCRKNHNAGIFATHTDTAPAITNNTCEENEMSGIVIFQGAQARISGNTCTKNKQCGISLNGLDTSAEITKNQCHENNLAGIGVSYFASASAEGNDCSGNLGFGVIESAKGALQSKDDNLANNAQGERTASEELPRFIHIEELEYGWCFRTGRFARLERLRQHYIATLPATSDATNVLEDFYEAIFGRAGRFHYPSYDDFFAQADAWQAAFPKSPAPGLLRIMSHSRTGWDARGSGYASTVTPEGWKVFHEQIGYARQQLADIEASGVDLDPAVHAMKVSLMLDNGEPKESIDAAFRAGVAAWPTYVPLYTARARTLSPQWGGTREQINAFLVEIPALADPNAAPDVYAQCLTTIFQRSYLDYAFSGNYQIDYPLACKGFDSVIAAYPHYKYAWDAYALAACLNRDQPKAKQMFDKIGENFGNRIWQGQKNYQRFRDWARGDTPFPQRLAVDAPPPATPMLTPAKLNANTLISNLPMPLLAFGGIVLITTLVLGGFLLVRLLRNG